MLAVIMICASFAVIVTVKVSSGKQTRVIVDSTPSAPQPLQAMQGLRVGDPASAISSKASDWYHPDGSPDLSKMPFWIPVCDATCTHIGGFVRRADMLGERPTEPTVRSDRNPPALSPTDPGATIPGIPLTVFDENGTPIGKLLPSGISRG